MAIMAQAVPESAYLPCIDELAEGWDDADFTVRRGKAGFSLHFERAGGGRIPVTFEEACNPGDAVVTVARAEGVRTFIQLRSITPRYAGRMVDLFPGGCISYRFDFARGPHIALMGELQAAVGLLARRQLRLDLRRQLSIELDP